MKRLHLIEFHEHPWCPAVLRDGLTDLLCLSVNRIDAFGPVFQRLLRAMEAAGSTTIVDLCSGAGGPWPSLLRQTNSSDSPLRRVVLTDLYPNTAALQAVAAIAPDKVHIENTSVDALQMPAGLTGFRTLFNAFHHFRPAQAQALLQNAVDHGEGIAIFELTGRSANQLAATVVSAPITAYLGLPFVRPVRPARWFLTYTIPALPVILTLDGVVSCLRSYSPAELRGLVGELHAPGYCWEIGEQRSGVLNVTYLIGHPD